MPQEGRLTRGRRCGAGGAGGGVHRWPRRALRSGRLGALLVGVAATSGCYRYVPVAPGAVTPNEVVRVRLTEAAATRVADELGAYAAELDGTVAPQGSDSLAVTVSIARSYHGVALDSARQVIVLGRSEVVDVRRSQLARGRTILTSAGVVAGFALLVHAVVQLTNPNPGTDETPPPPPPGQSRARPVRSGSSLLSLPLTVRRP